MRKLLIVAAVLLLLVAACGGGDDDSDSGLEGVARLDEDGGGSAPADGSDADARVSFEDGLLEFTICMRDNDVPIPDIQVDASGAPRIPVEALQDIDTSSPEFLTAFNACVGILADAAPVDITADPELNAAVQDQLQDFSECMRANGVTSFPDPLPGFDGTSSPFPITEIDTTHPDLESALDECQELISFPTIGG